MVIEFSANPDLYKVADRLYFGDLVAGHRAGPDKAVVHACKDPCHKAALGYSKSLESSHPHYLGYQRGTHLYLNLVDPPVPLFRHDTFKLFFAFVDQQIGERAVVIHCNQGRSRAPSLTMLYMAKRLKLLPDTDYQSARREFEKRFPYCPGKGIESYLSSEWASLGF